MKVSELKQDGNNYRKHSDSNKRLIRKSIDECGYGRSVVVDADGVLIAGNGVASVSNKDTKVKVIETDGSELVVVKRTDLHTGDEKRKKLAMADNAAADAVEWDADNLQADGWTAEDLSDWGVFPPKEISEADVMGLFEEAEQGSEKDPKLTIEIPLCYEDILEDIKSALVLTLDEWKGCKVK